MSEPVVVQQQDWKLPGFGARGTSENAPNRQRIDGCSGAAEVAPSRSPNAGLRHVGDSTARLVDGEDELDAVISCDGCDDRGAQLRRDLQAQVEDFLAQLPISERREVIEGSLRRRGEGPASLCEFSFAQRPPGLADVRNCRSLSAGVNERVDESCEFVEQLLSFCPDPDVATAVLRTVHRCLLAMGAATGELGAGGHRGGASSAGAKARASSSSPRGVERVGSPSFLEQRRELRLAPQSRFACTSPAGSLAQQLAALKQDEGPLTQVASSQVPARSLLAKTQPIAPTVAPAGPTTALTGDVAVVLEEFRKQDATKSGFVDRAKLVRALSAEGISPDSIDACLRAARVPLEASRISYESFVRWAFAE